MAKEQTRFAEIHVSARNGSEHTNDSKSKVAWQRRRCINLCDTNLYEAVGLSVRSGLADVATSSYDDVSDGSCEVANNRDSYGNIRMAELVRCDEEFQVDPINKARIRRQT